MRTINDWPYSGEDGMTQNFQNKKDIWVETNKKAYWNQLECVPPIFQNQNSFMVGECYAFDDQFYNCYAAFVQIGDRYFGKIARLKGFNTTKAIEQIKNQFRIEE